MVATTYVSDTYTRLTQKSVKVGSAAATNTAYTYNMQGRISSVSNTAYKYDTDGILVSRGTTKYLNDKLNPTGYSQVFVEATGSTKKAFACGHDLISQHSGSTLLTMLYDGLGSVRGVLNANGTIDGNVAFCYDAFGNTIGTAPSATDYRYAGERLDTTTGWYYLRQRYYDPKTGRFNRLDPFWGNASDPQSLHKYTYCHGDPVNHVDPSGEFLAVSISLGSVSRSMSLTIRIQGTLHAYNSISGAITNGFSNMYSNTPSLSWYTRFGLGALGGFAGGYLSTVITHRLKLAPDLAGGLSSGLTSAFTTILNCLTDAEIRNKISIEDIPSHVVSVFCDAIFGALSAKAINKVLPPIKPGTPPPRIDTPIVGEIMPMYVREPFGLVWAINPYFHAGKNASGTGGNTMRVMLNETLVGIVGSDLWSAFKDLCSWIVPDEYSKLP